MAEKMRGAKDDDIALSLKNVGERMLGVLDQAEAIARSAEDGDWPDIARDVRNLKQQVQVARGRVLDTASKFTTEASGPAPD
jgi:hypothetical protein